MTAKISASADGLYGSLAVGATEAFSFKPVGGGLELSQNDVIFETVTADGKAAFPNNRSANFIQDQLTGGNIVQANRQNITFDATGTATFTYPFPFANSVNSIQLMVSDISIGPAEGVILGSFNVGLSSCFIRAVKASPYGVYVGTTQVSFIVVGR